jgi:hypothetical protein
MFDEKFYSNTVINAEASILRAETAINSANSNIVKRGHGAVQEFCRRAIEWRSIGVHVEIMGHETNEFEVCSCGLRLHGKSIDKAVGHLDAQLQPTKLFIRKFEFYHYEVVCQECEVRVKASKFAHLDLEPCITCLPQRETKKKSN